MNENLSNYHVEYMDVTQHWDSRSEGFAGGDALVTFLSNGWSMKNRVVEEQHSFAGMRQITIYHIDLERDGETITMPVLRNPYISRMIADKNLEVITRKAS